MIDPKVLNHFGSTRAAIERIATAQPPAAKDKGEVKAQKERDYKHRQALEDRIAARIREGARTNLKNYRLHAAADLAWDSHVITKELVPLLQYAQGKIDMVKLKDRLRDIPPEQLKKFCTLDEKTKEIKDVSMSDFVEVSVNLVRSFVTRRVASITAPYVAATPMYKYEAHSTSSVAKLRGDLLSQLMEMVAAGFGYRHDLVQIARDELLYTNTVEFPACAWEKEEQHYFAPRADGMDEALETRIVKEGLSFVRPHPTRRFHDARKPLSGLNTDTGPEWIGFWDVWRYRDIQNSTSYYNRGAVNVSGEWYALLRSHAAYFESYFDCKIKLPDRQDEDVAGANDRLNTIESGLYTTENSDRSIFVTDYREKVIPKDIGIGDYPFPVWMRLVVASDKTIIYGEFLPSLPGVYYGYNENDSRAMNVSFAHDIMPWQDMMNNAVNKILLTQLTSGIKIIAANSDVIPESMMKEFREILRGNKLVTGPMLLEWSSAKLRSQGVDIKSEDILRLEEANTMSDMTSLFTATVQTLSLAERILHFSAQEQGQAAPREISATEVLEISNTTAALHAFHRQGIDEGIAAKKQLLYEAFEAFGSDTIQVPVVGRYSPETIEAAGFMVLDEGIAQEEDSALQRPGAQTIVGSKRQLIYGYNFSSRDGAERQSNTRSAEVLVNLLAQLAQIPEVWGSIGQAQKLKFVSEIVRLSGAHDISFEEQDGMAQPEGQPGQPGETGETGLPPQLEQILAEFGQVLQQNEQDKATIRQEIQGLAEHVLGAPRLQAGEIEPGVDGVLTPSAPYQPENVDLQSNLSLPPQ